MPVPLIVAVSLLLLLLGFFWFAGEDGRWQGSTWEFFRESGLRLRTLHGYIYIRWTPQYVKGLFGVIARSPQAGKEEFWFSQRCHGKILTYDHARAIISLDQPIERHNLDQIIPYPTARDLILQAPPEIAAYECVCRTLRSKHCEPTQVCMVVGRPFTDMVISHHPGRARRLTREEALRLLEDEHLRGHVHSAYFKDALMNRFYAICNCCKCCCGALHEMTRRGVPMVASSGYVAKIDPEACANCGDCVAACPFHAIRKTDNAVVHDWELCMGCGVCEVSCRTGAITMLRDQRKGTPLDVRMLAAGN